MWLLEKMRQQQGIQADRPQQVGGDGIVKRRLPGQQIFATHDSRAMNHRIQRRIRSDQFTRHPSNVGRIADIQYRISHARIGIRRLLEHRFATPGNDHLIAQCQKSLGQCAPDTTAAAGNQ